MSLVRRAKSALRRRTPGLRNKPWNQRWEIWSVAIWRGKTPFTLDPSGPPVLHPRDITDRPAGLVADPFLALDGDDWWLFVEVDSDRGEIGVAHSRDTYSWKYQGIVLSEPFHLSYPQVFYTDGSWYMIPETNEASSVRLYRAKDFPRGWEFEAELLSGQPFADASILRHEDVWWMWVEECRGANDTLRLFRSDQLTEGWTEHPASPVGTGSPTNTRPGGRILNLDGRLFRPAQDCAERYGQRLRAMEITDLSSSTYSEIENLPAPWLQGSGHGWNADGMHHIDPVRMPDGTWIAAVDGWTD